MQRRGVWKRRIARGTATVAVGALLGFLVPTVAADFTAKPQIESGRTMESPVARGFIDAYTADDQTALDRFGATADVKQKAARFKAEYRKVDLPVHLGSWVIQGGITVHAYASHVVDGTGQEDQLAWRIVTLGGRAAILDPPPSVQTP